MDINLNSWDAFISYTWQDKGFAYQLANDLNTLHNFKIYRDNRSANQQNPLPDNYKKIRKSKSFIFIVSPDSSISEYCHRELAFAIQLKKPILIIDYHEVIERKMAKAWNRKDWEQLARPNWLYIRRQYRYNFQDPAQYHATLKALARDIQFLEPAHYTLEGEATALIQVIDAHTQPVSVNQFIEDENNEKDIIFISYSRKNAAFVEKLAEELKSRRIDPWIDIDDIPKGAEWWNEIQQGITNAYAFVFVISPDSLKSEVCNWELAYALRIEKKLIPILHVDVFESRNFSDTLRPLEWKSPDGQIVSAYKNWKKLRHINFIRTLVLDEIIDQLIETANKDIEYQKQHTRLLVRALEWESTSLKNIGKRDQSLLLRGNDLRAAEIWLRESEQIAEEKRGYFNPASRLHREYLHASQKAEKRRRAIGLMAAITIVAMILVAIFLIGLWTVQKEQTNIEAARRANAQATAVREADITRSLDLANAALDAIENDNYEFTIPLALRANLIDNPPILAQYALFEAAYTPGKHRIFAESSEALALGRNLALSSDGNFIAVSGCSGNECNGTIYLWDVRTGQLINKLGIDYYISSMVFVPGEDVLLSSGGGFVIRWDIHSGQNSVVFDTQDYRIYNMEFIFGTSTILSQTNANGGSIIIWDLNTGTILKSFPTGDKYGTYGISIAPDGSMIAYAGNNANIIFLNLDTGEIIDNLIGHEWPVWAINFSSDGTKLVSGARRYELYLWDVMSGELIHDLGGYDAITSVEFNSTGNLIISAGEGNWVMVSDSQTGEYITLFMTSEEREIVWDLAFLPDGKSFFSLSDSRLILWDIENGALIEQITLPDKVTTVDFSSDNNNLFFKVNGQLLSWMYNIKNGGIRTYKSGDIENWAFHNPEYANRFPVYNLNSDLLLSISSDNSLELSTLSAAQVVEKYSLAEMPTSGIISNDGKLLILGFNNETIVIVEAATGNTISHLGMQQKDIATSPSLALSPDGAILAQGSCEVFDIFKGFCHGGKIIIWDIQKAQALYSIIDHDGYVSYLEFSPDGQILASASNPMMGTEEIIFWDVETGNKIQTFEETGSITGISFSPNGQIFAASTSDHVSLWHLSSGQKLATFEIPSGTIDAVTFSPDGKIIATGGCANYDSDYQCMDGEIRLWRVPVVEETISWVCDNRYIRELTENELALYNIDNSEPICGN